MCHEEIPKADLSEFLLLPVHVRAEVLSWIKSLTILAGSKPVLPAVAQICKRHNIKRSSLYRKQRDFFNYGWRGLINRAKYPSNPPAASNERFLRFIHGMWLANNKNYRNTHLQLVAIWKGGAPIPGYDKLPAKSTWNDCPDGWTYCNIVYHIKTYVENYPGRIGHGVKQDCRSAGQ